MLSPAAPGDDLSVNDATLLLGALIVAATNVGWCVRRRVRPHRH